MTDQNHTALRNAAYNPAWQAFGLAGSLGVVLNTVGRWERGERDVPSFLPLALETLERRMAAVLRQRADHAAQATTLAGHGP